MAGVLGSYVYLSTSQKIYSSYGTCWKTGAFYCCYYYKCCCGCGSGIVVIWGITGSLLTQIYLIRRLGAPFWGGFLTNLDFLFLSLLRLTSYRDSNV